MVSVIRIALTPKCVNQNKALLRTVRVKMGAFIRTIIYLAVCPKYILSPNIQHREELPIIKNINVH